MFGKNSNDKKLSSEKNIRRLTITSVLLSMAVLVNYAIDFTVPIGGAPILAIRFGGPFINFIAFTFGGVYGGIAGALKDIIGYLLKSQGDYIWLFTLVEFLKAFSIGVLWGINKKISAKWFAAVYVSSFTAMLAIGIANTIIIQAAHDSVYSSFILSIGKGSYFATIGLIFAGLSGLIALIPAYLMRKKYGNNKYFQTFIKMFASLAIPMLIFTTVNTVILQKLLLPGNKAFIFIWIPRFIEEIIQVLLNTYILFFFASVYEKITAHKNHN